MDRKPKLLFELVVLVGVAAMLGQFAGGVRPNIGGAPEVITETETGRSEFLSEYLPDMTFEGFTLYPVEGGAKIHLLNMLGRIVHTWNVDAERARLLPNGNLLVIHGSKWGRNRKPWRELRNTVAEYDWDGNIVWRYVARDVAHHDLWRLENGNTMFLRRTMVPAAFREKIKDSVRRSMKIRGDSVIEVSPAGKVVWDWHAHEHLDLNNCGKRRCRVLTGTEDASDKAKDWTHLNTAVILPENRWFDGGDERFRPGNIMILPRNWWTAMIIDRSSKEVVWEYGGDYRGGIGGGHGAHMIPKGFPGAGNILIFDNGANVHPNESFILEVNPVSKEVVWVYEAEGFFSPTRGSVQRLPNGNTFVSQDGLGRAFEVTPQKEIVWDYKGPRPTNRSRRYPTDYCPLFKNLS